MNHRPFTHPAGTEPTSGNWHLWLLPGFLFLLVLLQALPASSSGTGEVLSSGSVDHLHTVEPVLLSSREATVQVLGGDPAATKDRLNTPQKQFFILCAALALAGVVSFFLTFAGNGLHLLLPVQSLPGTPRGPPVSAQA